MRVSNMSNLGGSPKLGIKEFCRDGSAFNSNFGSILASTLLSKLIVRVYFGLLSSSVVDWLILFLKGGFIMVLTDCTTGWSSSRMSSFF